MTESLNGKTILVTGGARRIGKIFALACARAGADVVIPHRHSEEDAQQAREEINALGDWEKHLAINLTAPFLLSQAFARQVPEGARIVNLVNGLALGAILPPADGKDTSNIIKSGGGAGTGFLTDLPSVYYGRDHVFGWRETLGMNSPNSATYIV